MDFSEVFLKKHALNGSIKGVIKAKKVAELRDACDEHLQHDTTRRVLLDTTRLGRLEHLEHALPEKIARLRKVLDGGRGNSSGATEDAYDAANTTARWKEQYAGVAIRPIATNGALAH